MNPFICLLTLLLKPATDLKHCLPSSEEVVGLSQTRFREWRSTRLSVSSMSWYFRTSDGQVVGQMVLDVWDDSERAKSIANIYAKRGSQKGPLPIGGTVEPMKAENTWSDFDKTGYSVWLLDGRSKLRGHIFVPPDRKERADRTPTRAERARFDRMLQNMLDRLTYMGFTSRPPSSVPLARKQEVDARR